MNQNNCIRVVFSLIVFVLISACQQMTTSSVANLDQGEAVGHEQEIANKIIAVDCIDLMFNQKKLEQARTQCFGDIYIQHSPRATDGADEILKSFAGFFSNNPELRYDIKRSAADGELVWIHSHMKLNKNDLGHAVVDIFRVKDGKLVEHWSALQPVAEKSLNSNTMF